MTKEKPTPDVRKEILKTKGEFSPESISRQLEVDSQAVKAVIDTLMADGYRFIDNGGIYLRTRNSSPSNFDATKLFKDGLLHFGLISDSHLGSKKERLDCLEMTYDRFQHEGIKTVFHVGDWMDGVNVYKGQELEVNVYGQQAQIDYTIDKFPKRSGIQTIGISGNHDEKGFERGGADPMVSVARARRDITYIGQYDADIKLGDNVTMELMHPTGNVAYALSYKAQRDINNRSPDNLPNILAYGHYHTSFYMHYRGIEFLQVPCFKDAGYFEKRLGLNPTIGAWIIDGKTNGETIQNFKPDLFTFGGRK